MPTSRAGNWAASPAGFTLIELTIVLVVMGIAAGLTLPRLAAWLSRENEKSASRIIQGILRRAQAEALLSGREWRVDLDWKNGQCRATQYRASRSPRSAEEHAARAKTAPTVVLAALPAGLRPRLTWVGAARQDAPEVTSIVLLPEGLCQPAFIRLPGTGGRDEALEVSAVGCRVRLLQTDLDAAQERFRKAQGMAPPPWRDSLPGSRG